MVGPGFVFIVALDDQIVSKYRYQHSLGQRRGRPEKIIDFRFVLSPATPRPNPKAFGASSQWVSQSQTTIAVNAR
jgi:hypothetical protein